MWKLPNQPAPVHQVQRHPTKVMVWGCFSAKGAGRLHICEGMMNATKYVDVLKNRLVPQMREWYPDNGGFLLQDKAPCHTANIVAKFIEDNNIQLLPWAGNSPDLNPIENLWGIIKRKLKEETITSKQELIGRILHFWNHDASVQQTLISLANSMPNRVEAVIKAKGGPTKY